MSNVVSPKVFNPIAKDGCHIMLIERKSNLHTGTVVAEMTRSLAEQLRPV